MVLRLGGVYSDVDTECRQPMDSLIRPKDTMVVGWENEFESPAEAEHRHYVRSRQVRSRVRARTQGSEGPTQTAAHSRGTWRDPLDAAGCWPRDGGLPLDAALAG